MNKLEKEIAELKKRVSELEDKENNFIHITPEYLAKFKYELKEEPRYFRCMVSDLKDFNLGMIYKEKEDFIVDENGNRRTPLIWEDFEEVKKPEDFDIYYFIADNGFIDTSEWKNNSVDLFRWDYGNVFNEKDKANNMLKIINGRLDK
jgi:hypothetical protein